MINGTSSINKEIKRIKMIAHFLASDERETSLLVKTGSHEEAMKLQKYIEDQIFQSSGSLKQFNGVLLAHWTIGKFYTICFEDDLEALEAAEQCIRDYVNKLNSVSESKNVNERYDDEPTPFEDYVAHIGVEVEEILRDEGNIAEEDKYLRAMDDELEFFKPLFIEDLDEEEAANRFLTYIRKKWLDESIEIIKASGKNVVKE